MKTVNISAAAYDEALAFCNARLAERGKPAITELPAGKAYNPTSCPCANTCDGQIKVYVEQWWNVDSADDKKSGAPGSFVTEFDNACAEIIECSLWYPANEDVLPVRIP